jgi:DNA-dependent RNA polymerase auxiliary subunit epsilon
MVYQVRFQNKPDAADPHSKWTDSFFVESESRPELGRVRQLVEKFAGKDFAEETIEIQQCSDLDARQLRKQSVVYNLD